MANPEPIHLPWGNLMRRHPFFILVMVVACASIQAQKQSAAPEPAKKSVEKTAAELEAERVLKERRANAQSLLVNLAADARNFSDATVRARTQARIADALWDSDPERSRAMFRSAFDAAETADAESDLRVQEDIRQQQAQTGRGGYVIATPPNLRHEVLTAAGKHDQKLGEELLTRYKDQKATERSRRPGSVDEVTSQRFELAKELLNAGDITTAIQYAERGLASVNVQSVDFLASLREKDSTQADNRYRAMLDRARLDPQADANTVGLLASYIFSPHLYISFQGTGVSSSQMGSASPVNSPYLRESFFRAALAILLRPTPEQSTAGPDGQYLAIKRMLPLFEQFAPPETTVALKTQLENLAAVASNNARTRDDDLMHRGIDPDKPRADRPDLFDREQSLLDRADRAKTSAERDQIYLELAMTTVDKDDRRARDYVDKIDDMDLRNAVRGYIDASIAFKVVSKKDVDRALELAKNGDLTHLQRSWLLSQTAGIIGVKDRERAAQVLEDAAAEARRIETGDPDRPKALLAIANVVLRIKGADVWGVMDDVIRAANSAEKFTGEDGEIVFRLVGKGTRAVHQHAFPDFNVAGIFAQLANEDYDKAVELARGLQGSAPRANAVIALARSILDEKKK
jgi:hypothetical protein